MKNFLLLLIRSMVLEKNKSATALLEDFSDCINDTLDNNKIALALFLDLSKAFDTIDHALLLEKLERIGFRGPFYDFFHDYLTDRFQLVKIENCVSAKTRVQCGVPQGSTLGPLLFNIYINELNLLPLQSRIFLYADDTVLLLPYDIYENAIPIFQKDVDMLLQWFSDNIISVNNNKTKLVCFRNPHKQVKLTAGIYLNSGHGNSCKSIALPYEQSVKYLGIFFDEHILWNQHIEFIKKRLRVVSAYLYRLKSVCGINVRKTVFMALGESILRYGITVFGQCAGNKKLGIDRVLKQIASNVAYGTRYDNLVIDMKMNELNIMSFSKLYEYVILTRHYYDKSSKIEVKKRNLRCTERYVIPRIFTNYGKRMKRHYIPSLFNKLPDNLIGISSMRTAKKALKKWCLECKT